MNNMKSIKTLFAVGMLSMVGFTAQAGNPQRAGSAGASELLINPWASTSGFRDGAVANVKGIESAYLNVAGLAYTEGIQVGLANTQWLVGAGIQVNAAGLAAKVGESGVLGLTLSQFDYGDWEITTEDQPEGVGATIAPQALTIGLSYAQKFTRSITGGVTVKMYNSSISNLNASGIAFDAGVQYHTGDLKEFKFGIVLRNVGPSFGYSGDGFSLTLPVPTGNYTQTFDSRSAQFELPTQLSLGASYDWHLEKETHILTFLGSFTSNSFIKDVYTLGAEYSFKEWLKIRGAYGFDDNRADNTQTNAMGGLSAGFSFIAPLGASTKFAVNYAYRTTNSQFNGIHTVGVSLDIF